MACPLPSKEGEAAAELLVFGDLTASFTDDLHRLLHIRGNESLTSFFERVAFSLRQELGRQPSAVQDLFPRFTTLIDLAAGAGAETEGAPILQFALMTVCQLAKFIHFAAGRSFPSPDKTVLLGICTGSFAAAAISVSRSLTDVVLAGVEATLVAFKTALCSFLQRNIITTAGSKPWSVVIPRDKSVTKLVDQYINENSFTSKLSTIYISATTPSSATISGPPHVLDSFLAHHNLSPYRLPIRSPFHAAHIFSEADVESTLSGFPLAEFQSYKPLFTIISGSSGAIVQAADFKSLLQAASTSVLREKVDWEGILASTGVALTAQKPAGRCTIYPFFCSSASLLSSYLVHEASLEVVVENMMGPRTATQPSSARSTGRLDQTKIAIVGYSGRYPEAESNEELWSLLQAGRDVHRDIPEDRFNWETYNDPTGKKRNTNRVRHGCFINKPGLFDTQFFNMSPREAASTDPAHRLAITATYEAMEMAGMVPNRTPSTQQDRVGVFFGVTSDDWREVNSSQDIGTYFIPGGVRAFLPGRISYFFRFSGPSLCIDTACSSSFAAIQSACSYLLRGDCDTAIAGGTNILTNPDIFTGLDRGHFLAGTGNCNTFDDEASGYCRAEAVGSVILKRLEDAIEDNDPIFGVIAGSNTNHCGQTESITRPHEGDQVSVFNRVLRYQGVDPNEISYIEMHGTGTQAGDATEMRSVLSVFLPDDRRSAQQPLYLGSVKSNIGHAESASGVVSLIKVLMMMKNAEIPPHCGIKTRINRNYPTDLAQRNVRIAMESTPWRRESCVDGTRKTFLNNFSAAGGNTALLLEDAPLRPSTTRLQESERVSYLVTVTAKTAKSLAGNLTQLQSFLRENPSTSLPALSYTTTARRIHHKYRVACSGTSIVEVMHELAQRAQAPAPKPKPGSASKTAKVVFVFSGQGSLYSGLGRELYQTSASFRDDVLQFNNIAQQHGFPPFLSLIDGSAGLDDVSTCSGHLAQTCLQMALSRLWSSWGVHPAMVVGHSLGEYAALFAAGVLSASDAIFLVGTRATLLDRLCRPNTHGMLAIKAGVDSVRPLLATAASCEITCINQPNGTVVGGERQALNQLAAAAQAQGHQCVPLDIPFSFHTAQVEPILADFAKAARGVRHATPAIPVLSPLLAGVVRDDVICGGDYLARACRGVVDFKGALEAAWEDALVDQDTIWLELGSHPACGGMIKATLGPQSTTLASVHKSKPAWACTVSALEVMYAGGLDIDWNNFHRGEKEPHEVLQLPRYSWDLKNHWIAYKNDFLLTKGECCAGKPRRAIEARYISPSVQRVLEENHTPTRSTLLAESELLDSRLAHVMQGHKVNGVALCPSTLYGDIAFTVAKDVVDKNDSVRYTGFDVSDVKIDGPLIASSSETSHLFRISVSADWAAQLISLSIFSVDEDGRKTAQHATANVRLSVDRSVWLADWRPITYLVRSRIASLEQAVAGGNSHKLKRSMVYKLFGSIVDYAADFQGMQEVILDSDELEATAKVCFRVNDEGFLLNPKWIDSLGHIAGFIMNGNEYTTDQQVYINHGWSRLRFGETPQPGKVYTTYSKMQLGENKLHLGDVYILDGERIIGIFDRVAFQAVPRKILDRILPNASLKTTAPIAAPALSKTYPLPLKPTPLQVSNRPAATQNSKASSPFSRILVIIAEELGVMTTEIEHDMQLADLGLDSLLSLTISSRISEEMSLDLPSTLFVEHSTVQDLSTYFSANTGCSTTTEAPGPGQVPELVSCSGEDGSQTASSCASPVATILPPIGHKAATISVVVRQAVANETGIPVEELENSACLADLGVDSLLGLTIADSLTEALGADISSNLVLENQTVQDLEVTLGKVLGHGATAVRTTGLSDSSASSVLTPSSPTFPKEELLMAAAARDDDVVTSEPHATTIVLHHARVAVPRCVLFLFADGSGSAASYAQVAKLDPRVEVRGLNCPWRTTPEEMTRRGVKPWQAVAKYVAEIRRNQPRGPYYLGGWSAGGIFALEAARMLAAAGETTARLLLLDAPNPVGLENPPARMFDFFESAGVFGGMSAGRSVPRWLRHHFDATVQMLDGYEPRPLPSGSAPPTVIIYAKDGICSAPGAPQMDFAADDPREMLWLLRDRTDFSAAGWRSLLGPEASIQVHVLKGVDHFSMMKEGPRMEEMREHIRRGILGL